MRFLASLIAVGLLAAPAVAADPPQPPVIKQPPQIVPVAPQRRNLVPVMSKMQSGIVMAANTGSPGSAAAGSFKITIECKGLTGSPCAVPPPGTATAYQDPAFPGLITVQVPGLAGAAMFAHKLTFWSKLKWQPGSYQFTVVVDAAKKVNETSESDNISTATMLVK